MCSKMKQIQNFSYRRFEFPAAKDSAKSETRFEITFSKRSIKDDLKDDFGCGYSDATIVHCS